MYECIAAAVALCLAAGLVRLLMNGRIGGWFMDVPNARSLHATPVPRIGGLGLLTAAFATWIALGGDQYGIAVLLTALLATVSLADDALHLSPGKRLLFQFAASAALLAAYPANSSLVIPLACLTLVWMTNLYNFMDGSDGLAGGMTLIGFGTYAVAAHLAGASQLALLSACVAGAAGGFLVWNFPKARVFMGDAGSAPLGFLAAALGFIGWQEGAWPFFFAPLVFSPFIADATVTLCARYSRGEKLSEAHRTHYYQRALQMGLGHRGTALAGYALMLAAAMSALATRHWGIAGGVLVIAAWAMVYTLLMRSIDRRWASRAAAG